MEYLPMTLLFLTCLSCAQMLNIANVMLIILSLKESGLNTVPMEATQSLSRNTKGLIVSMSLSILCCLALCLQ